MENKDINNKICSLLKKKLELFNGYLSLTERIKEIIGSNTGKGKIHAFLYERRDCINSIDMIDGSIKKLIKVKNFDKNHHIPERLKEVIDPYLKAIRDIMGKIYHMDSELLAMAKEETEHFQTRLLQMRKFRQGMLGYGKRGKNTPRFLDTTE